MIISSCNCHPVYQTSSPSDSCLEIIADSWLLLFTKKISFWYTFRRSGPSDDSWAQPLVISFQLIVTWSSLVRLSRSGKYEPSKLINYYFQNLVLRQRELIVSPYWWKWEIQPSLLASNKKFEWRIVSFWFPPITWGCRRSKMRLAYPRAPLSLISKQNPLESGI